MDALETEILTAAFRLLALVLANETAVFIFKIKITKEEWLKFV